MAHVSAEPRRHTASAEDCRGSRGRRTSVSQKKCERNPVGGRAAGTGVDPLRGRHYPTTAATMSTGAQIRRCIMPLIRDGQIGNVRWCGLGRANGWRLFAGLSLPRGRVRKSGRRNLGVGRTSKFVNPYGRRRLSEEAGQNGHESGFTPLGHKARARGSRSIGQKALITRTGSRSRTSLRAAVVRWNFQGDDCAGRTRGQHFCRQAVGLKKNETGGS